MEFYRLFKKWKIQVDHECTCGCIAIDGYHNYGCCCVEYGLERLRPVGVETPVLGDFVINNRWLIFASKSVRF